MIAAIDRILAALGYATRSPKRALAWVAAVALLALLAGACLALL
jgi:hypothetical protein